MAANELVGLIIAHATTLAYPELLPELVARLQDRGLQPVLYVLDHEADADAALARSRTLALKGIICAARPNDPAALLAAPVRAPLLLYNCQTRVPVADSVSCDHAACGRTLAHLLLDGGHRRVGLIASPPDSLVGVERIEGAAQMLEQGRALAVETVRGDYSYESGAAALDALFARMKPRPSAIIAANDAMALGALDRARALQVRMPRDLSIVGIDGTHMARLPPYDLTTMRQPLSHMADAAVKMLLERIADPDGPWQTRLFSGELILGATARLERRATRPGMSASAEPDAVQPEPEQATVQAPTRLTARKRP